MTKVFFPINNICHYKAAIYRKKKEKQKIALMRKNYVGKKDYTFENINYTLLDYGKFRH